MKIPVQDKKIALAPFLKIPYHSQPVGVLPPVKRIYLIETSNDYFP